MIRHARRTGLQVPGVHVGMGRGGDGAAYPNRTDDLLFTRQLLYQLS